jgi:hypothetical protein
MADPHTVVISGAVEGDLDEAVLRRLVEQEGAVLKPPYGKRGKSHLKQRLAGYNRAARLSPWIVLMDLNHDADCAPPLRVKCLPNPACYMCFRIAVRAIESWLLADHKTLAQFLSVAASSIPSFPETLNDPKHSMVELAKRSRRREIREGMVPRPESGRRVGPTYTSQLIEFAQTQWRPDIAAHRSDSLRRCRKRIHEIIRSQA